MTLDQPSRATPDDRGPSGPGRRTAGSPADRARRVAGALPGARMRPSFLIVGAEKAGTTSLYDCLVSLPDVLPATRKEVHYFDLRHDRGDRWYRRHFPRTGIADVPSPRRITGEASPYYLFHPHVPRRVADSYPDMRIVVLLRDPVDRAHSAWAHRCRKGTETRGFAEALAYEQEAFPDAEAGMLADPRTSSEVHREYSYAARGDYLKQILNWRASFPAEQMHVVVSEKLFADPAAHLPRLQEFLGLSTGTSGVGLPKRNTGSYQDMAPAERSLLRARYREQNERLAEYLGEELPWQ